MFSRYVIKLLGSQHSKVVTDVASGLLRVNNIVNKPPLSTNHWVGEPRCVFEGILLQILLWFVVKEVDEKNEVCKVERSNKPCV